MSKTSTARTATPEAPNTPAPAKAARPKGALRAVDGNAPASETVEKTGKAEAPAPAAPDQPKPVKVRPGLAPTIRVKPGEKVREDGLPEGGIDAKLVDAILADGGALHSELNALTGWKGSSRRLARAALIAGVDLTKQREGDDTRFIGTRAPAKTA